MARLPVAGCRLPACCLFALVAAACGAAPPPSQPAPAACPSGDVAVQVDAEAAVLAACTSVSGRLTVGPSFALRSLAGLDRVVRVTGELDISDNAGLTGVYLPALVVVEGDLVIEDNRQVATVSLHRLVEVRGDLTVRDNPDLVRLDLGALRRVGGRLEVSGHPALDTVVLDRLERAGQLVLEDNPAWPAEDAERVRRQLERR
jgi:hypothetical protein